MFLSSMLFSVKLKTMIAALACNQLIFFRSSRGPCKSVWKPVEIALCSLLTKDPRVSFFFQFRNVCLVVSTETYFCCLEYFLYVAPKIDGTISELKDCYLPISFLLVYSVIPVMVPQIFFHRSLLAFFIMVSISSSSDPLPANWLFFLSPLNVFCRD